MSYAPLWCKSNYSFLEGASHPDELVSRAAELGLPAIAITDRDGVYGIVRAHVAARDKNIKLIVGAEMSVDSGERVVLLVRNREGYANLCQLISQGRLRNEKGVSSVYWDEICSAHPGTIALLAPECDRLAPEILDELKRAYRHDLYFLLPRHAEPDDPYRQIAISEIAGAHNIPIVATTEVLYHTAARKPLHDVCRCIAHGVLLDEAGALLTMNDQHEISSRPEMEAKYSGLEKELSRSLEIASRCIFSLDQLEYRYPSELLPQGFSSAEWLRQLTFDGAAKRYDSRIPEAVRRQLENELGLIEELNYGGYFLTMWEIVQFCGREEILCQGRGSAANSAVCYCLGITAVDPVRMDLLFERFISRERAEPPDIDLDIEHRRREEVIQYMYQKYGRDRAAMVANVVRYRSKSSVREVGKVLGIPATTLDRLAKMVSFRDADPADIAAEAGLGDSETTLEHLVRFVNEIRDFPRHLSIHPGGFLLGSEPVSRIVPIENATMPDRTVIQWDKYDVEELGLFKVDLLGLGALTHLHFAFDLIRSHIGEDLSMAAVPPSDNKVFELLEDSDTVGVFQLESRAQMAMLPRLRPRSYYDIVIEISIVRPGPITGGMVHPYLRRRNGEEEVVYPHPSLEPILRKTLGVPLFQEQVMKLAMVGAGYTPGEADQLRRDMAAWRRHGTIERHHERLVAGMRRNDISEEFAERVFQQIRGFGEYGFPESHAASFALIAYSTAWVRARFPVVFTCALLNAWPMGFYSPATIVEDAKRHGVVMLPVSVLESQWECLMVDLSEMEKAHETKDGAFGIRMGLRFVKGLNTEQFDRIERTRGEITDSAGKPSGAPGGSTPATLEEFQRRARLPEDVLVTLAESGALSGLAGSRREAIWRSLAKRVAIADDQRDLRLPPHPSPLFRDLSVADLIGWDHAALSHSTGGHSIEPYRSELEALSLPDAETIQARGHGERVQYAGLVICRQRPETASGTLFLTLEDETGFVNCILWSATFQRFRTLILTSSVLAVSGKLQKDRKVVHIIVERCWVPTLSMTQFSGASRDFH